MKFFERLKNSLKKRRQTTPLGDPSLQDLHQETAEDLWFSLCEKPNQEDKMPLLLHICEQKGGTKAIYDALENLSGVEGSWLPQVYLGRLALEQNDFDQASQWYQSILSGKETSDYALLMISADLGKSGYAARMPELLSSVYDADKHDIYIGLNLLQSYQEIDDPSSGLALLQEIRRHDRPEIHEYLESFAAVFFMQSQEEKKRSYCMPGDAADLHGKTEGPADAALYNLPGVVLADIPVWNFNLAGIDNFIPKVEQRKRVGIYMYADTSATVTPMHLHEDTPGAADLAVSLPLIIGESLLFTTNYAPAALYPVSREEGPLPFSLEPDVQSLFALCSKESLDFVITGTVFLGENVYRIRSWIIDKANQSARIVAKDLSAESFGEPFKNMISEIMMLFYDKRYIGLAGRSGLPYAFPPAELAAVHLQALKYLLYQNLVHKNICSASILPDDKAMLDIYAYLARTDTKSQQYLMMLLAGMKSVSQSGSTAYLDYRQLLYDNADKNRYSSCVKAMMPEMNLLLKDK